MSFVSCMQNCRNVLGSLKQFHNSGVGNVKNIYRNVDRSAQPIFDKKFVRQNGPESSNNVRTEKSDTFGTLKKSLESQHKHKKLVLKPKIQPKIIFIDKKNMKKQPDERDQFGTLSETKPIWYPDILEHPKEDNDQDDDSVLVRNLNKKLRCPRVILSEMKKLVLEKKLKEALELFVTMKRNHVTPQNYHFTYMIGACGRAGYTEMAFKLLRQMTDRKLQPTPATLTGLFNSCAECPFPDYGLQKAKLLKEKIEMKSWHLNQITYHSMIKAFGKCGDIQMAFQVVDEMAKADIKIDVVTYSFLLMSCIANKEAGFTHAIEVWRQMKKRKCQPNIFTCNLLLRSARDCDIGPEEISSLLLQHWSSYSKRPYGFKIKENSPPKNILQLPNISNVDLISESNLPNDEIKTSIKVDNTFNTKDEYKDELDHYELKNTAIEEVLNVEKNLLNKRPKDGPEILELLNIKEASARLSLLGGMDGFIKYMLGLKLKPDIKTFSLLLECLPDDIDEEEKLINLLDLHKVRPDIDFFNILIKRRNFRKDSGTARKVLLLLNKYGLEPDIMTFGALALGCRSHHQAVNFLNEIKKLGICPNVEIIGTLIGNACRAIDFQYLKLLLKFSEESTIKPNDRMISKIEDTLNMVRNNIIKHERGKETFAIYKTKSFFEEFKNFCTFYEEWLRKMDIEIPQHIWLQYSTDIIDRPKEENVHLN